MKNEEQDKPAGEETVEKTIFYEQDYAVDSDRTDESGSSLSKPGTAVYQDGTTSAGVEGDAGGGASEWADDAGVGEVFAGRFEVQKLLGEGGMGRVYLAGDRQVNGRQVALKVLLPSLSENTRFRDLFFQEIDAATRFVSENVIQVRDTGQLDDGKLFLTMDYVEGESLDAVLAREGTLGVRHALEITRQILLGLGGGHAKGYIHRDLKPSNVMLAGRTAKTTDNPHGVAVRLLDFGIAGLAAKLETKKIVGTPFYMSPEQLLGEEVDLRADLFAVGVVLYELLAGERPFQGKTLRELTTAVLEANVSERIREIESIPKSVRGILQKALSKKRDERFQSSAEFVKAIERSKAFKAMGSAPALTSIVATVAVLVAGGEGAYIVSEKFGAVEAKIDVVADQATIDAEVAKASQAVEDRMDLQIQALKSDNSAAILQLQGLKETADAAREEASSKLSEQLAAVGVLKSEKEALAQGRADLELEKSEVETDLREARREIVELKAKLLEFRYELRPEVLAGRAYDDVVGLLNSGSIDEAVTILGRAQLTKDSYLRISSGAGGDLLEAALQGFVSLRSLDASGGADTEQLSNARQFLETALAKIEGFSIVASKWIKSPPEENGETPPRQAMAEDLVALLASKLEKAEARVAGSHDSESTRLRENPIASAPADVIDHGLRHECEDASTVLTLYADALSRKVEQSKGLLDLDALREFPNLAEWGSMLTESGPEELPNLDLQVKAQVLEYARARQWYVEMSFGGATEIAPARLEALSEKPSTDWRRQLMLQEQIWNAATSSSGGPNGTSNPMLSTPRAYYRVQEPGDDGVLWYREDQVGGSSAGASWSVERRLLGERPTPPSAVEITLDGDSVQRFGRRLFRLAEVENVQVGAWSAARVDDVPTNLGFPPRAKLESFRKSLLDRPLECLVLRSGNKTYWISPEVGLVLEEEDGVPTQQLVYFDR